MTLNDLEILNGHFTLNFHWYEPRFQQLGYILALEFVYTRDQRRCAEADPDPQNIWIPRKNCGSFVDATSSEP